MKIVTIVVKITRIAALKIATANAPLSSGIGNLAFIKYKKLIRLSSDNLLSEYKKKN